MVTKVKCEKENCRKCKYCINLTGAVLVKKNDSSALIACGYILKTGHSRVFEDGHVREDYEHGYCNCYEPGKRVDSLDSMCKHTTLKKGRRKKS